MTLNHNPKMVSFNLYTFIAIAMATAVASKPIISTAGAKDVIAGKQNFCKKLDIDQDFEQYVKVERRFKKTEAKEEKRNKGGVIDVITSDQITQFNSTMKFDLVSRQGVLLLLRHRA